MTIYRVVERVLLFGKNAAVPFTEIPKQIIIPALMSDSVWKVTTDGNITVNASD